MSKISIGDKALRKFALLILDSPDGIDARAYETLSIMLAETGNEDIMEQVDIIAPAKSYGVFTEKDSRAYIGEDFAEEELAKLEEPKISEARIEDPIDE